MTTVKVAFPIPTRICVMKMYITLIKPTPAELYATYRWKTTLIKKAEDRVEDPGERNGGELVADGTRVHRAQQCYTRQKDDVHHDDNWQSRPESVDHPRVLTTKPAGMASKYCVAVSPKKSSSAPTKMGPKKSKAQ